MRHCSYRIHKRRRDSIDTLIDAHVWWVRSGRALPLAHENGTVRDLLSGLDLGSSVAETDGLLEIARIETSAFTDVYMDRVDLVPGTKGSGKSALFRMFVEFLPDSLLKQRKVVVAHGVQAQGDPVFHAFADVFSELTEDEFVSFWCVYLVSLAHEHFIKGSRYSGYLQNAGEEIQAFQRACSNAGIPEIVAKKTLKDILLWSLQVLARWKPRLRYKLPHDGGDLELDLFGTPVEPNTASVEQSDPVPKYVNDVKLTLEGVLAKSELSLWLMVDRLDEVFPRRSELETKALRGLLRAMRFFDSKAIRVKIFLRDDMLDSVVRTGEGFTALTHVTSRQADTLRWDNEQIQAMIVRRIVANEAIALYLDLNAEEASASAKYRALCFDKIFPPTVFAGSKQSSTLAWICNHCADGRGVVTPRDVLDLLLRATQRQQDICSADPSGTTEWIFGSTAIRYGMQELSKRKRQTYLEAEFPHLWVHMKRFVGGKTEYNDAALRNLLGSEWEKITEDFVAIGFMAKRTTSARGIYTIPFLYRHGMDLTQGKA